MIILPINCDIFKYQSGDSRLQAYRQQRTCNNGDKSGFEGDDLTLSSTLNNTVSQEFILIMGKYQNRIYVFRGSSVFASLLFDLFTL